MVRFIIFVVLVISLGLLSHERVSCENWKKRLFATKRISHGRPAVGYEPSVYWVSFVIALLSNLDWVSEALHPLLAPPISPHLKSLKGIVVDGSYQWMIWTPPSSSRSRPLPWDHTPFQLARPLRRSSLIWQRFSTILTYRRSEGWDRNQFPFSFVKSNVYLVPVSSHFLFKPMIGCSVLAPRLTIGSFVPPLSSSFCRRD